MEGALRPRRISANAIRCVDPPPAHACRPPPGPGPPPTCSSSSAYDYDADVDVVDYAGFSTCMANPSGLSCACFDEDHDTDVDLPDFGRFQTVFGWTLCQPADPSFERAGEHGNAFAG